MTLGSPCSSIHGILQARILEWVATSFSMGLLAPRIEPVSPTLAGRFVTTDLLCGVCVCVCLCVCVCKGGRQGEGEREREKRRVGRNKIVLKSNYSLTYKWKACFVIQELLLARTGHVSFIISTNCLCLLEYPISTHSRQCLYFNHSCC